MCLSKVNPRNSDPHAVNPSIPAKRARPLQFSGDRKILYTLIVISISMQMNLKAEESHDKLLGHAGNLSAEKSGSDRSSTGGSELYNSHEINHLGHCSVNFSGASYAMDASRNMERPFLNNGLVIHSLDLRQKLNRILAAMQQRLVTAKADMEDIIARLNQETAVKEYLTKKVKDLEAELETAKRKSKEELQNAILLEREKITQIWWDADEVHRRYMEMESNIKFEQVQRAHAQLEKQKIYSEKELILQELDNKTKQLTDLRKCLEELKLKSRADIKVLAKEVKILRHSQAQLKELLNQSVNEKTELERNLQIEKERRQHEKLAREKLLTNCGALLCRLQESTVNFLAAGEDKFIITPPALSDALGLLTTSDARIGLLLQEAQRLAWSDGHAITDQDVAESSESSNTITAIDCYDPTSTWDDEMRKLLATVISDNAKLRKQVNSAVRYGLKTTIKPLDGDRGTIHPEKNILARFLKR